MSESAGSPSKPFWAWGSVWRALDTELDRAVAIKIPRSEQIPPEQAEGFVREARAAAQLKHPNIVGVHEVGRDGSRIYIVSDLIEGMSLAQRMSTDRFSSREAAELAATIAGALDHAHAAGVVHRDLKPANVLLDPSGRPHVTDFGLAKRDTGEITMTVSGAILGTPAYMSPEQAGGESHDADARSDVYSLGVMLFELLTGERPFRGNTRMLMQQVMHDEAPLLRSLNHAVPRDLETICLKCLEKDPARRFQSAGELQDELQRFLEGVPIHARPIGRIERATRWCRRHPAATSAIASVVALLATTTVAAVWINAEREEAVEQRSTAETRGREIAEKNTAITKLIEAERTKSHVLQTELARAHLHRGLSEYDARRFEWALAELLRAYQTLPADEVDLRRSYRRILLDRATHGARCTTLPMHHDHLVYDARFSSDGRTLVTISRDETVRLWDAGSGLPIGDPVQHDKPVGSAVLNAAGDRLLIGGGNRLQLVELPSRRPVFEPLEGTSFGRAVFDAAESRILSWGRANEIELRSAETGQPIHDHALHHPSRVMAANFHPDDRRIVTGCEDGSVHVWDADTGAEIGVPFSHGSTVWRIAISDDGRWLATAEQSGRATVWNLDEREKVWSGEVHDSYMRDVRFSPGTGESVATASGDATARLFRTRDGTPSGFTMRHEGKEVKRIRFGKDETRIVTCGDDGTARLWNRFQPIGDPMEHDNFVANVRFNGIGDQLATASWDHTARIWPVPESLTPPISLSGLSEFGFGPYGAGIDVRNMRLVSQKYDGLIHDWDLTTGQPSEWSIEHDGCCAISRHPTANRFLTVGEDGVIRTWDSGTGREIGWVRSPTPLDAVHYTPDGTRILAHGEKTAYLLDAESGKSLPPMVHDRSIVAIAFCPTKPLALTAEGEYATELFRSPPAAKSAVRVWNTETGELMGKPFVHDNSVFGIAFSPDGTRVATAFGKQILVWEVSTSERIATLSQDGYVNKVQFGPEGRRLLAVGPRLAQLWDLLTNTKIGEPIRLGEVDYGDGQKLSPSITALAYSPTGEHVAIGGGGVTRFADTGTGIVVGPRIRHPDIGRSIVRLEFTRDGQRLVITSSNAVTQWSTPAFELEESLVVPFVEYVVRRSLENRQLGDYLRDDGLSERRKLLLPHFGDVPSVRVQ